MRARTIQNNHRKERRALVPICEDTRSKKSSAILETSRAHIASEHLLLKELREALAELRLIEQGKLEARPIAELMDAL